MVLPEDPDDIEEEEEEEAAAEQENLKDTSMKGADDVSAAAKSEDAEAEPIIEDVQINSSTIKKPDESLIKQPAEAGGGNDLDDLSQDIFDNFSLAV